MSAVETNDRTIHDTSLESLNVLVRAVQELSLARDLNTVMQIVRTAARKLTGADGATFVLRDGDLCYYADEDAISPLWKGQRFPMSACISGWTMLNRQAAVIKDIYLDERIPADAYRPTFVKSLVMVPIRTIDPIGAIGTYWAESRQPTAKEVWLLQSLADVTAVTMENVSVYEELEKRVRERTRQLEIVNKELEAFSYTVSHDLKAPLRIITGYSTFLLEDHVHGLTDEGKAMARRIFEKGTELRQLIDHLLTFFKTTTKELHKSTVSMKRIVSEIADDILRNEQTRNIEFIINEIPEASADASLMKQVWFNLISNAVKYTGGKEKAIIEIGAVTKGNTIVYYIKDNGAGFDMRYHDKLFGVFQRLHKSDQFEGSGIGLASVQRIISRHGGNVWAEATVNEGATFYFLLNNS